MSLQSGLDAYKQGHYQEAIHILEEFSQNSPELTSPDDLTAQMCLVKAYQAIGDLEKATIVWQKLIKSDNPKAQKWARENRLTPLSQTETKSKQLAKAGRAATVGVSLAMGGVGGSLALASGVTIALLFGMVFVLGLTLVLITNSSDPVTGLAIAISITLIFNLAAFFLSPFLMDFTQSWLYQTRWVNLAEIENLSRGKPPVVAPNTGVGTGALPLHSI